MIIKDILKRVYTLKQDKEETPATVSIEEHNKIKQVLKESNAKVQSLTEENKSVTEKLNTLQSDYRRDIITALHEGCYFKSTEDKKSSIDSFTKSKMSFEEIKTHLDQVRYYLIKSGYAVEQGISTKLPQRNGQEQEQKKQGMIKISFIE